MLVFKFTHCLLTRQSHAVHVISLYFVRNAFHKLICITLSSVISINILLLLIFHTNTFKQLMWQWTIEYKLRCVACVTVYLKIWIGFDLKVSILTDFNISNCLKQCCHSIQKCFIFFPSKLNGREFRKVLLAYSFIYFYSKQISDVMFVFTSHVDS